VASIMSPASMMMMMMMRDHSRDLTTSGVTRVSVTRGGNWWVSTYFS